MYSLRHAHLTNPANDEGSTVTQREANPCTGLTSRVLQFQESLSEGDLYRMFSYVGEASVLAWLSSTAGYFRTSGVFRSRAVEGYGRRNGGFSP